MEEKETKTLPGGRRGFLRLVLLGIGALGATASAIELTKNKDTIRFEQLVDGQILGVIDPDGKQSKIIIRQSPNSKVKSPFFRVEKGVDGKWRSVARDFSEDLEIPRKYGEITKAVLYKGKIIEVEGTEVKLRPTPDQTSVVQTLAADIVVYVIPCITQAIDGLPESNLPFIKQPNPNRDKPETGLMGSRPDFFGSGYVVLNIGEGEYYGEGEDRQFIDSYTVMGYLLDKRTAEIV